MGSRKPNIFSYTYVLSCGGGQLYVGSTIDLKRRVSEHEAGKAPDAFHRLRIRISKVNLI
jgi:putative endonuclease